MPSLITYFPFVFFKSFALVVYARLHFSTLTAHLHLQARRDVQIHLDTN